jgi:hypothetical protein
MLEIAGLIVRQGGRWKLARRWVAAARVPAR